MRIISGFLKGKKMNYLKSSTTRPLRDFVKENTFNVIKHSNLINISLEDTNVLDFYSGVGSFGIECISRGAKKVTFVESDKKALTILQDNIKQLKIDGITSLTSKFIQTIKNKQVLNFFENCSFELINQNDDCKDYFLSIKEYKISKIDYVEVVDNEN